MKCVTHTRLCLKLKVIALKLAAILLLDRLDFGSSIITPMKNKITCLIVFLSLLYAFNVGAKNQRKNPTKDDLPLEKIKLPEGFKIEIYAKDIADARSLSLSPNGTLFVGNRNRDKVYAVRDEDGDYKADKTFVIAEGLKMPCGVAYKDGDLFVAELNRVIKFEDIERHLDNPPKPIIVNNQFPKDRWHGWKFIAFGPDDKLYVPVGAPCNVCDKGDSYYASITRMNADGTGLEVFARGVRNSVGFDWHPKTKVLWFTDNGRDMMGDDLPSDELNRAPKQGMHFGFPYCHQGDTPDPKFGDRNCEEFTPPAQKMGAHVAALGMRFYTYQQFPKSYQGHLFIAQHGSWNRSSKVGYRVMFAKVEDGKVSEYKVFAEGWLNKEKAWGRPVDLVFLPDGSMLLSDDKAGVIYRIYYDS